MIKISKKIIGFIAFLALFILFTIISSFQITLFANAEESLEDKCIKYTSDDNLKNDGVGNIVEFAKQINDANLGDQFDLTQIIPVEYLRVDDNEPFYYYIGTEYGFFVKHNFLQYLKDFI